MPRQRPRALELCFLTFIKMENGQLSPIPFFPLYKESPVTGLSLGLTYGLCSSAKMPAYACFQIVGPIVIRGHRNRLHHLNKRSSVGRGYQPASDSIHKIYSSRLSKAVTIRQGYQIHRICTALFFLRPSCRCGSVVFPRPIYHFFKLCNTPFFPLHLNLNTDLSFAIR